jgi:glycerate 2-kinase
MRILIAPDKFKGSLTAKEVAENIAAGLRHVFADAEVELTPIADGGEGTAEIIGEALGGEWTSCQSHDALGRAISARYCWVGGVRTAVMEMSEAAGLRHLTDDERSPSQASTFGVGEMMRDAIERGAHTIIIGLGGSATNDGGFGMARALRFRFFAGHKQLVDGAAELTELTRIIRPEKAPWGKIMAAVDVCNPLLGVDGATSVFGPQKGAGPEQIALLEMALTKLADIVSRDLRCDFRNQLGAGAAGGLGFGLMSFCNAELRPGFELVAEALGLKNKVRHADIVVTGEGRLDAQTLDGKGPAGVARMAVTLGKPVYAIVGEVSGDSKVCELFNRVFELTTPEISRETAIKQCGKLLRERATELARLLV